MVEIMLVDARSLCPEVERRQRRDDGRFNHI